MILPRLAFEQDGLLFYGDGKTLFVTRTESDQVTEEQIIRLSGTLVFFPQCQEHYFGKLVWYLGSRQADILILWVKNPESDAASWNTQMVFGQRGLVSSASLAGPLHYPLRIPAGCRLLAAGPQEGKEGFLLSGACGWGRGKRYYGDFGIEMIPDGALDFSFQTGASGLLEGLECGICYGGVRDTQDPRLSRTVSVLAGSSLACEGEVSVKVRLCPNRPENGSVQVSSGREMLLHGCFSTVMNQDVTLRAKAYQFVFQQRADVFAIEKKRSIVRQSLYLCLTGSYQLADAGKLRPGTSGTEYFEVKSGMHVSFLPGQDAFYRPGIPGLSGETKTSYISLLDADYYGQPQESPLYRSSGQSVMEHFDVPWKIQGDAHYPVLNYKALSAGQDSRRWLMGLEQEGLGKVRQDILRGQGKRQTAQGNRAEEAAGGSGVILGVDSERNQFAYVRLAGRMERGALAVTGCTEGFSGFMQREGGLLAVGGAEEFERYGSHPFLLDEKALAEIEKVLGDTGLRESALYGTFYFEKEAFLAALREYKREYAQEWKALFLETCANMKVSAGGIVFGLSPYQFGEDALLLWKMGRGSVRQLMETMEIGEEHRASIQQAELSCYDENGRLKGGYGELTAVLDDENFQGIVAFSVPVMVEEEQPALSMLLSGMGEQEKMTARFVIVRHTMVRQEDGELFLPEPSFDALIDYENRTLPDVRGEAEAGFFTERLFIQIKHSAVAQFDASCRLILNRLFASPLEKAVDVYGNGMRLQGQYQKEDGQDVYRFLLASDCSYCCMQGPVDRVIISQVSLELKKADEGDFILSGGILFHKLEGFDLFSFGGESGETEGQEKDSCLAFSGLAVVKQGTSYSVNYEEIRLLTDQSRARQNSFVDCFPARATALGRGAQKLPADLSYTSIRCPIPQGVIEAPYFYLQYEIPIGGLGGAGREADVKLSMIAAWSEGENTPYYIGIRWEENGNPVTGLCLQSFLDFRFRSASIRVFTEEETSYQMEFHDFKLSAFGFSFPPGNQTLFLLGDRKYPGKVGWYTAYKKGGEG